MKPSEQLNVISEMITGIVLGASISPGVAEIANDMLLEAANPDFHRVMKYFDRRTVVRCEFCGWSWLRPEEAKLSQLLDEERSSMRYAVGCRDEYDCVRRAKIFRSRNENRHPDGSR